MVLPQRLPRSEGFTDDRLSATVVRAYYSEESSFNSVFLNTYHAISPNEWVLENSAGNDPKEIVGSASIDFIDYGSGYQDYEISTPDGYSSAYHTSYEDSVEVNCDLSMYRDPAQVYIATDLSEGKVPQYTLLDDVRAHRHYTLTAQDFMPMKLMKTIKVPSSAESASMFVRGYYSTKKEGYHRASVSRTEPGATDLPVYQPENVFSNFDYSLSVYNSNMRYYRTDSDNIPGSYAIPESVPATVVSTDRSDFNASIDYPSDYASAYWLEYNSDHPFGFVRWSVHGSSEENIQLIAPQLPESIKEVFPSLEERVTNLPYGGLVLVSKDNIDSFEDHAAGLYQRESSSNATKVYETINVYPQDAENSRTAQKKLPKHIQDELNRRQRSMW